MTYSRLNYAKLNLEHYLKKIRRGDFKNSSSEVSADELLALLFTYVRKIEGLHLRWQYNESSYLAHLTILELQNKKKTDPVLNNICNALLLLNEGNQAAVEKYLAQAENRLKENSLSQSTKAKSPRYLNPVLQQAQKYIKRNKSTSPKQVIDRVIDDADNKENGIEEYLDSKFIYLDPTDPRRLKSYSLGALRNEIPRLIDGSKKFKE